MKFLFTVILCLTSSVTFGAEIPNGFTPEQEAEMAKAHQMLNNAARGLQGNSGVEVFIEEVVDPETNVVPFAEYDDVGYLLFNASFNFDSKKAKKIMAENLPAGVKLVVYGGSKTAKQLQEIRDEFSQWISPDRLEVISLPTASNGFWARDGVPVPVWENGFGGGRQFTVVDARYYHGFEVDQVIADHFYSDLFKHSYYFEGGNFMANTLGDCIIVNKVATMEIPDSIFSSHYGCKTLIRLPHVKGIGHVDESVKFINDSLVMTDEKSYIPVLEKAGFDVVQIRRPRKAYETYVNALLINGTAFVPVFGQDGDAEALETYRKLGFKVFGLDSKRLSNVGKGSIHCITMAFPPVAFRELLEAVDGASNP